MPLVDRGLGKLPGSSKGQVDGQTRTAIQSELLDIITEILLLNDMSGKQSTPRKRYLACRKAIVHVSLLSRILPPPPGGGGGGGGRAKPGGGDQKSEMPD